MGDTPSLLRPDTARALAEGRVHFDAGRWFEAHEVWEQAWKRETGGDRLFLQALIVVAAACHKAKLGHAVGAVKLFTAADQKLGAFGDGYGGLAVAALQRDVTRALEACEDWEAGGRPWVPTLRLGDAAPR